MSPLTSTLLTNLALIFAAMIVLWIVSLLRRDASIIDPVWGLGFVAIVWISSLLNRSSLNGRVLLLAGLTTLWGLRLSLFLLWRNWNHSEDRRYQAMRRVREKSFWWWSLFAVFLLQGGLMWFISLPLQIAAAEAAQTKFGAIDFLGLALWCTGLFFEAVGDWQLHRFKTQPENVKRVMEQGLWKYTRHPNYFGDFCIWWGRYLIAAAGGAAWTLASPLVMSLLLMKVSGVALLESTISGRRPEYESYKKRTNAFFPGRPRPI